MKKSTMPKMLKQAILVILLLILCTIITINCGGFLKIMGKLNEPWAILISAIIATLGVSLTIYYQKKSDKNRNTVEYITNSRIEWSYRVRKTVSRIIETQKNMDILLYGEPFGHYKKDSFEYLEKNFKKNIINLKGLIAELTFLFNPLGDMDQIIIYWTNMLYENYNENIYETIIEEFRDVGGRFIHLRDTYEVFNYNDIIADIIIDLTQLYLKLEWERIKKETDKDTVFDCEESISIVFDNIAVLINKLDEMKYNEKNKERIKTEVIEKKLDDKNKIIEKYTKYFI